MGLAGGLASEKKVWRPTPTKLNLGAQDKEEKSSDLDFNLARRGLCSPERRHVAILQQLGPSRIDAESTASWFQCRFSFIVLSDTEVVLWCSSVLGTMTHSNFPLFLCVWVLGSLLNTGEPSLS